MFEFFHDLFENLFEGLIGVLLSLFEPVLIVVDGFYYFLTKVFSITALVVQIIFGMFKVLGGITSGAYNTFSQLLNYSGSADYYYMPAEYQQGWSVVTTFLDNTGISNIALIMAVFVWLATAYALVRIAGEN